MKIWIENPFDNLPIEGFRAQRYWLMSEAFVKAGHEVVLWTSDFNHTTKRKRAAVANGEEVERRGGEPKLRLIKTLPYSKNVSLRRIVSHLAYAFSWWRAGNATPKDERPDLIILSTPPICTGLVAWWWKKKWGTKVVLDIMDLWPETFERVAPKWVLKPMKKLADFIRSRADLVTSVAEAYPGATFYHGISVDQARGQVQRDGRELRIVYIGNTGITYDLKTVEAAVSKIKGATFEIAGPGYKYLNKEELEEFLAKADIGVVPMAPESCVGVPYKFADYAKAGLAIVSSLGGESAALMKKYGAGEEYKPHDVESLTGALERVRSHLEKSKIGARKLAEEVLDAKKIYARYVEYVISVKKIAD